MKSTNLVVILKQGFQRKKSLENKGSLFESTFVQMRALLSNRPANV